MVFKKVIFLVVGFVLISMSISAEENFGVNVYPGAKYDSTTSKTVADSMHVRVACYRTSDGAAKVTEFYKKQADVKFIHQTKKGAMFEKGNIDITIQNPWMDMKSGKIVNDTLISIVKNK